MIRSDTPFSVHHSRDYVIVTVGLATDGIYLDHLAKVVSPGFLYYNGTIFPIIANKYFGGDNFRQSKCPFYSPTFAH